MCEESYGKERLPRSLETQLPTDIREAMQHPYRRQILRVLHGGTKRQSPAELARSGQVPCSTPCTGYHMRSLQEAGLVREAGSEQVRGSIRHYFSSLIGDKSPALAVLKATEKSDRQLFTRSSA